MSENNELSNQFQYAHDLCFICNRELNNIPGSLFNLLTDKTKEDGSTPSQILNNILNRDISSNSVHSENICSDCVSLCAEYEEIEQRLVEIRLDVIRKFNKTAIKWNLTPVDVEDDEIIDDDEFHEVINGKPSNDVYVSNPDCEIKFYQSNAMNENLSQIQIINSNGEMEDIVVEDYEENEDDAINEDDGETREDNESLKQEYFDEESENMVEIITENDNNVDAGHLTNVIEESDTINEDTNSMHKVNITDDDDVAIAVCSKNDTPKNIVYNIKLEPVDDDNTSTRYLKKKQSKTSKSPTSEKQDVLNREEIFTRNDEKYACELCKNDENIVNYDCRTIGLHLKSVHDVKLYFCDICGNDFRRRSDLNDHLDEHITTTEDGCFTCEVCHRVFSNLRLFRIHKRLHYATPKTWECDVCLKKYSSKNLLDEHLNMHTGLRPWKCNHCEKDFASKYTLSAHQKTHDNRPRPFKCSTCMKSFYSGQNLIQHEKTHLGIKPHQCEKCDKCFSTQHNLEVHKIIHSGFKPFICRTCGKAFARRAEIRDHERVHSGEKPFKCNMCESAFAQRSNLQSHKRATHLDDKRYVCDICDRRFKRRRLLDYHKKATHTGERPYACELCSATFVYPEHFKKHLRIHTGVKPYACEICKKSFNSRDNRNAHRFVHSDKKPYECTVCGQGFMRKPLLFAHMKSAAHLRDKIIINQPRIMSDGSLAGKSSTNEFILETQRILIDKDTSNSELCSVLSNDDNMEQFIEEEHIDQEDQIDEEEIIDEEDLIIDGHVQLAGEQISGKEMSAKEILEDGVFIEGIESGQIYVSEDGQLFETENGTVQFIKIDFDKNDKTNPWMKVES